MQISDFLVDKCKSSIIFCRLWQKNFSVGPFQQESLGDQKHTFFWTYVNITHGKLTLLWKIDVLRKDTMMSHSSSFITKVWQETWWNRKKKRKRLFDDNENTPVIPEAGISNQSEVIV